MSRFTLVLALHAALSLCPEDCMQGAVRSTQSGVCEPQCSSPQCGSSEDCLRECMESGCQGRWLADGNCNAECSALICGLDRGDCGYCSEGCYLHMLEDEMCQEACFVPECDFDSGKCEDCAPHCFADEVYVYEGTQAGDGSAASPHPFLRTAIEAASSPLTAVYLLGPRVTFSFPEAIHSPILISSLTCGERRSPFCSSEVTTLDIVTAATFTVRAAVTFQRVVFTTLSIFERLEVKGCPTLVMQGGAWVDGDSTPASEDSIAAWSACAAFSDTAVFAVEGGSLRLAVRTIQSANVTDLLVQPKAFIQVKAGNVVLEGVHFEGVETLRGAGVGAVILADCEDCGLRFWGGSVQHLNAGLRYVPDAKGCPFLYAKTFRSLEIAHVAFKSNTVIDAYSSVFSPSTRALLYLGNFYQVALNDCAFHRNFVSGGLVAIDSSVQLPRDPDADNVAYQLLATHIDLQHISFQWNLGERCLVCVSFAGDVLNVNLIDAEFTNNAIEGEKFLSFESQKEPTRSLAFGAFEEVLLSSGTRRNVWVPPRTIVIRSVAVSYSYAFYTLVFIRGLVNVNITLLEVTDSGDSDLNVLPLVFATCCSTAPVVPSFPEVPACYSLLWFDGCLHVTLTSSQILRCSCYQSSDALIISTSQGLLKVSNLTAADISGFSEYGLVLGVFSESELEGDSLVLRNNTNDGGSVIYLELTSKVELRQSLFEDNAGVYGGVFNFYLVQQAELRDCTFRRTTAIDSMAGVGLWWSGNFFPVKFSIIDCVFEANTAISGAAFTLDSTNITTVLFTVKRSLFVENDAVAFGSAIYATEPLFFADGSVIEDSTFRDNTAAYGTVWLKHTGALRISNCLFQDNYGLAAAAIFIETPPGTTTLLEDVRFLGNYGSPSILKSNLRTNSTFISRNCTFIENFDGSVAMEGGFWKDFSSVYTHSESSQLSLSYGAIAQLFAAEFSGNTEARSGGAVHAMTASAFKCFDCVFANNSAGQSGGAVFAEQEASVYIEDCLFTNNSAESGGGALSLASSQSSVSVVRSSALQENYGGSLGAIFAQAASILLENVTIDANTGEVCPGITLLMGHATIKGSVFQWMSGSLAAFLSMYTSSSAVISDTEFAHGSITNGGAIYLSSLSSLTVSNAEFHNISSVRGGAITALSSSRVSLSEVTMADIESEGSGSLLYLSDSSLSITACEFSSFRSDGIYGYQLSEVTISSSVFAGGEESFGAAADFNECMVVGITDSVFKNLKVAQGGALHFGAIATKLNSEVRIDSCHFMENEADIGGAIYAINHNLAVLNSVFSQNNASEGGALYFDCSTECVYSITESVFTLNSAAVRGGAVAWSETQPTVLNVTFANNTAAYGLDLASFPLTLQIDNITHTTIAPGQTLDVAVFASLRDHYSQVVTTDSSSVAHLKALYQNATVAGETKVTASEGHFVFDKFQVYALPNSSTAVTVTSATVQADAQQVAVSVRECRPGEFQTLDSCVVCSPGTFSFDPSNPCQPCLKNALCLGDCTVIPIHGFWRSGALSPEVRECPNQNACLGGKADNDPLSLVGRCATGYQGNLCQSCQDGFSRTGKNNCDKCPPKGLNVTRLAGLTLVVAGVVVLMTWSAMRSAYRPAAIHSVLVRILVNYLQLVVLVSEFKLNWPVPVIELFKSQESVGRVSEQLYSVDCFLADERMSAAAYYRKNAYMALLPCGLSCGAILIWAVVAVRKRSVEVMRRQCVATLVILFFLVLPNIVQAMFSMLSCTEIEKGEMWLTEMMDVPCWNPQHYRNLMAVALPGITVWVVGVPLLCLLLLVKFRKRHDEIWLRVQFGFIINGYMRRCYYWEFVILYRKVAIICVSVFISTSIPIQALTVQFVLLIALIAQYKTRPFNSELLNSIELRSLLVADVTVFCGLYFLTNDISSMAKWFFFIVIIATNVVFLVSWSVAMLGHLVQVLAQHFRLLKRLLNPGQTADEEMERLVAIMAPTEIRKLAIADRNLNDCYRELLTVSVSVSKFRSRKYRMWPFYASSGDITVQNPLG